MKEIPKQFDCRFLLQINLTEDLEVADVGHRIWTDVLRVQLKVGQYISEIFLNREG